ncbi:hypothetical protein [Moraxella bovis]|uniref:Uncharacterized protein n=1 Tax=Moraxella bovis TaxID=476 RepID=A0A378PRV4_MORBO|nr:hypothetical protein [Moraxella bovis]STY91010.1 Uncharacterised protein [Moraxella bovis]
MMRLLFVLVVFIIGVMGLQACHADNSPLTPPQTVTLHFGHQGVRDFYAYTHATSDDYPEIMSFYELDWGLDNLGTIHFDHFDLTTTISNVSWVMGTKNSRHTHGIGGLDVHADLSKTQYATAEQAYQDYVALITAFKKAGWQQYFEPQHARIAKEDNVKILTYDNPDDVPNDRYVLNTRYSSDSLTPLTFEEWQYVIAEQETKNYGFELNLTLYLRDINVWINISPFDTKPNPIPSQPDLKYYKVRYEFNTAKYEFYRAIRGDTIEELKQDYDDEYETNKSFRQDRESNVIRAGFSINEDYQDPDMWQYIIEPAY